MKSRKALRVFLNFFVAVVVLSVAFVAYLAASFSSWEDGAENNFLIQYNKLTRRCVIGSYEWDGNTENMTMTVPDEYEGIKVEYLGGVTGRGATMKFFVNVPEEINNKASSVAESEDLSGVVDESTVTYTFTVNLGKNIRYPDCFSYKEYYSDENGKVVYIIEYNYECSPENKWIYSESGKLYDKKTNQLIS